MDQHKGLFSKIRVLFKLKTFPYIITGLALTIGFQGCTGSFRPTGYYSESAKNSPSSDEIDLASVWMKGEASWKTNCLSCHGEGASSNKRNRSLTQIQSALQMIPQMQVINLNVEQLEALAFYLNNAKPLPPASDEPGNVTGPALAACTDEDLPEAKLRRLNQLQLKNSLEFALGIEVGFPQLPDFGDPQNLMGLDNSPDVMFMNDVNTPRYFDSLSSVITQSLTENPELKNCSENFSSNCVSDILDTIGKKAWRRPLTTTEKQQLQAETMKIHQELNDAAVSVEFLVSALFVSPHFIFRSEIGNTVAGVSFLNPYEVASLLSFTIWNTSPDLELLDLAESGEFLQMSVLEKQVDRMLEDERKARGLTEFYLDYLRINRVQSLHKEPALSSKEQNHLYRSAELQLEQKLKNSKDSPFDVFSGTQVFVSSTIAKFFGKDSSQFENSFDSVHLDSQQREGILSHPAFLTSVSGSSNSGIVQRGVFTLEQLLCYHLPPPPDDISQAEVPPNVDLTQLTSREVLHLNHSSQPACIGCHDKIDPAGAGFENYDTFGNFRLVEKGSVRIDSSGQLQGALDPAIGYRDSADYIRQISQTDELRSCTVKHWAQFSLGSKRPDNCHARELALSHDMGSLTSEELIKSLVLSSVFRKRKPIAN